MGPLRSHRLVQLVLAALVLMPSSDAAANDASARTYEQVQRQARRERSFLLLRADDLSRAVRSVNETVAVIRKQVDDAANGSEERNRQERRDILAWYLDYAGWLERVSAEYDRELSGRSDMTPAERPQREEEIAKGQSKRADQLEAHIRRLEGEHARLSERMRRLNTAVVERRILVEKDDLDLAREIWPSYRDRASDHREAVYKDLNDAEVLYFRNELQVLAERQKYYECLSELGKYEILLLRGKADRSLAMGEVAKTMQDGDSIRIAASIREAVRRYETDAALLARRAGEIKSRNKGITRTGTLGMLDRLNELSLYYDSMQARYEQEADWLSAQIGYFQAELVDLGRER